MGTNYYMITKNPKLAHEYFAEEVDYGGKYPEYLNEEYKLCDVPDFYYEIHLNKCSYGWRPLFQRHKCFKTFAELEQFIIDHKDEIQIKDEYDDEYTFRDYKLRMINHATYREPEPMKWTYGISDFDKHWSKHPKKTLHTIQCKPKEAELWIPFSHVKYTETEAIAQRHFGIYDDAVMGSVKSRMNYSEDPNYPFDWCDGEFS